MISLEKNAKIILTDSGGVQEEACILQVPSLNLRENTERPECIEVGASKIVSSDFLRLKKGYDYYQKNKKRNWKNPFGNGKAYQEIFKVLI